MIRNSFATFPLLLECLPASRPFVALFVEVIGSDDVAFKQPNPPSTFLTMHSTVPVLFAVERHNCASGNVHSVGLGCLISVPLWQSEACAAAKVHQDTGNCISPIQRFAFPRQSGKTMRTDFLLKSVSDVVFHRLGALLLWEAASRGTILSRA